MYWSIPKNRRTAAQHLINEIWGLSTPGTPSRGSSTISWHQAEAYLRHYDCVIQDRDLVDGIDLSLGTLQNRDNEVIKFAHFVKNRLKKPLVSVQNEIRNNPPAFLLATDDCAVNKALKFIIRLSLFAAVNDQLLSSTSHNSMAPLLHEIIWRPSPSLGFPGGGSLSNDFSAKSLIRKGGFSFKPTGNLDEHLTFEAHSRKTIRFFACAKALEFSRLEDHGIAYDERYIYEIQNSLQLLFPTGKKNRKKTKRYVRKFKSDLEAAVVGLPEDKHSLSSYPVLGERLAEIQKRYDKSTPYLLRQWWYDRRNRLEWATLMVAIIVFILTVVFGVISSVTGILQVHAAYKWH